MLQRVYIVAAPESDAAEGGRTDIRIWVEDLANSERAHKDSTFHGSGE